MPRSILGSLVGSLRPGIFKLGNLKPPGKPRPFRKSRLNFPPRLILGQFNSPLPPNSPLKLKLGNFRPAPRFHFPEFKLMPGRDPRLRLPAASIRPLNLPLKPFHWGNFKPSEGRWSFPVPRLMPGSFPRFNLPPAKRFGSLSPSFGPLESKSRRPRPPFKPRSILGTFMDPPRERPGILSLGSLKLPDKPSPFRKLRLNFPPRLSLGQFIVPLPLINSPLKSSPGKFKPAPKFHFPDAKFIPGNAPRFRFPAASIRPLNLRPNALQSASFNPQSGRCNFPVFRFTPFKPLRFNFPPANKFGNQ